MSFSGTLAVTQTVLRSATVISAAVGSFQNSPGATSRSITLPAIGATTVTVRDLLAASGSTPICLQVRGGPLVFDLGRDVVRFRLLQIFFGRAADLFESALPIAVLERERQQHLGPIVIGISGGEIRRVDHDERLARFHPLAELDLELRDRPASGGDTLMRWAGSASTTAGSTKSRLTSFSLTGSTASLVRTGEFSGTVMRSPDRVERSRLLGSNRRGFGMAERTDKQPIPAGANRSRDDKEHHDFGVR